ncbi:hypothetical protein EIP91_011941 [Steccherinum ochraceum]|uniref:BTB domain-containing protein n=1 Tax=Steccherinum ochraceum TaxID=92696 RepID=A0A4R0RLG8_9APHY|nr:hypothetical protein EIP91_011941 [Steccherinum ochraceum]
MAGNDSDTTARKRARTDEGPSGTTYTRGDLWYKDGNIILIAEDGVGFRVYRGILSQWSEIFRDMFTVPQPVDVEKWEGCAVVHLSDSSRSLARVLRILFADESSLVFHRRLPIETVAAMLQLGTKYQIHHLRQEAISRLVFYFPPRLEDFKNRHATDWVGSDSGNDDQFSPDGAISNITTCHVWTVIVLARALDLPALLPPAFYLAAQYDTLLVFEESSDEDGVDWTLSADDTRRVVVGQEQLRRRSTEFLVFLTDKPSPGCASRRGCMDVQHTILRTLVQEAYLDTAALLHARWIDEYPLCSACTDHFTSHYEQERMRTWSELAEYFVLKEVKWPATNSVEQTASRNTSSPLILPDTTVQSYSKTRLVMADHASSTNPRKRARVDVEKNGSPDVAYKRGDVWFDDGNIILVSMDGTGFRVYRGVLSKYSEVFRDMFIIPQPADAETWEGCSVVHLADTEKSLSRILPLLFNSDDILGLKRAFAFETVVAMLQLGSKYQIHHLRQDAVSRLTTYFPTRLGDFMNNTIKTSTEKTTEKPQDEEPVYHTDTITNMWVTDVFAVINLARAHDLPDLLPAAFYMAAQNQTTSIFSVHTDLDHTEWQLCPDDIERCIVAQDSLRGKSLKFILLLERPSPLCSDRQLCKKGLSDLRRRTLDYIIPYGGDTNVLQNSDWLSDMFCKNCDKHFVSHYNEERQKIWADLPKYFDLTVEKWPGPESDHEQNVS